jgi:hypothetical protein
MAIVALAILATTATGAGASLCRGSFLGCRTRAQRVRYCQASCRSVRALCTSTFERGRLQQRCRTTLVSACLGEGGTCVHPCSSTNPCPTGRQCVRSQCIFAVDRCPGGCPSEFPNCGPDGRCWTLPCANLCGNDNCCGADFPVCGDDGLCHSSPGGGGGGSGSGGFPANLPPGNYSVSLCISGYVSLPCQSVGTIPLQSVSQFQSALDGAINAWLAATAGLPDCTRGATTYSAFDGSSFTASLSATCTSSSATVSETVSITVHLI